jgi:phosphoglycerol transferase MdoB-like AlkP superfamily enzyme
MTPPKTPRWKSVLKALAARCRELLRLRIPRDVGTEVAALLLPLAVLVIGVKLYKLGHRALLVGPLTQQLPIWSVLVAPTIVLTVFFWARARWFPRARVWRLAAVTATLLIAAKVVKSAASGSLSSLTHSWVLSSAAADVLTMYGLLRWDVAFLMGFGLVASGVLALARGRPRRVALWGLYAVTFVLLFVASVEVGFFHVTGTNGTGHLLVYVLNRFGNLAFLMKNELRGWNVLFVFLPLGLIALSFVTRRMLRAESTSGAPALEGRRVGWVWPLLVVCAVPPPTAVPRLFLGGTGNVFLKLVADLAGDPFWRDYTRSGLTGQDTLPLWDARELHLEPAGTPRHLNLVFIILESAGARYVNDSALSDMPFVADLGKRSLVIDEMYVVSPATSRAWVAILAGVYPDVASVASFWERIEATDPATTSLPKLLRPLGYRSAFFSASNLLFEQDAPVIGNRGFDLIRKDGDYDTTGFAHTNYSGYEDRIALRPTLAWVDAQRGAQRPFFLTFMTLTGHHDYRTPPAFPRRQYPGITDRALNDYLNALHYVDDFLRDLFAAFAERDLLRSTVFVIIGDHGEAFGEHEGREHVTLPWEEVLHVPALMYGPALWPAGGRITGPRQQIDLLPTVADVLGYRLAGGFTPGVSLLRPVAQDRPLYFTSPDDDVFLAVRTGARKYIYWFERNPMEVYDVVRDPRERVDLAGELSVAQADSIASHLLRWRQRVTRTLLAEPQPSSGATVTPR